MNGISNPARDKPPIETGNYHHKYTSRNPLIRWLTGRFLADLDTILSRVAPKLGTRSRVLEVGCGEGEIAKRLYARWDDVVALDLHDEGLRNEWRGVTGPLFLNADAEQLPFEDGTFDLTVCIEVLEHLRDAHRGMAELARVGRGGHLVLSVPREPLFRLGNAVTGRHITSLGNTPGHLNHWSTRGFIRFVQEVAEVREVAKPFPWTMLWARSPAPRRT